MTRPSARTGFSRTLSSRSAFSFSLFEAPLTLSPQSILTSLFSLPKPHLPSAYYHSLLTELCRLSPSTIAPALGKCVRRLYAGLGADADSGMAVLDPEGVRRFSEWFSIHLSNYGFMWGWGDWCVSVSLFEVVEHG